LHWPRPSRTALDSLDDLSRAVDECLTEDLLVFSGGSSVGHRDLIMGVIAAKGEVLFHGIAVKPGKASRCRRSRHPATSPACRRPTAISRSRPTPGRSSRGEIVEVKLF
jgi:hypothetical protein